LAGLWPPKGAQYKRSFLSGSSIKSFTPDTADMRRKRAILKKAM
jgi:hypothetical protein